MCFLGGGFGYLISLTSFRSQNKSIKFYKMRYFFGSMWFMPYIRTYGLINKPLRVGLMLVKGFDQG